MRERNIDFLDLYKSVDRFIRDAYSSKEGVSEYMRKMEAYDRAGRLRVGNWTNHYNMLKRVRWIRNQLAHEVGYDSDICEEKDYEWLKSFYKKLYAAEDPLAVLDRLSKEKSKKQATEKCAVQDRSEKPTN